MLLGRFNPINTYSKKGGLLVEAALRALPGTMIRSRWLIGTNLPVCQFTVMSTIDEMLPIHSPEPAAALGDILIPPVPATIP